MNINLKAVIRTAKMLAIVALVSILFYLFAIFGMLPGVIILIALIAVFLMYSINKSQIEYEDRMAEITKKYSK